MAGAGYKLFQTGDVLTAAQVNTYLQEQTVMVFANSTARTTALSGVLAEGMMSYLQDTNSVEVYNGTSWVNVGNAGDITEVQAGVGISIASGTGPIPVITNSSTDLITTAGDILYGTAADTVARLGIGTAGQVLKVNSGATAPEWGAAASGALTLIARTSFSNVASQSFDNFSTTYKQYMVIIERIYGATAASDLQIQFRAAGVTSTSGYYGAYQYINLSAGPTRVATNNGAALNCNDYIGDAGGFTSGTIYFGNVTGGYTSNVFVYGQLHAIAPEITVFGGYQNTASCTGFLLKSSSGNVTGDVAIYGLATA